MALEAIVGEDAAQIGMVREEDAEHVPHLALQPDGGGEHLPDRIDRRVLVGRQLPADALVQLQGPQVVAHLEARGLVRPVDVGQLDELLTSAERGVGSECISTGRSRWLPSQNKKKYMYKTTY